MEDDVILKNIDSLWFFSSILSPSSSIPFQPKQPAPSYQSPHSEHAEPPTPLDHAVSEAIAIGSQQEIKAASKNPKEFNMEQRKKTSSSKRILRRRSEHKEKYAKEVKLVMDLGLHFSALRSDFQPAYMLFSGHEGGRRSCQRFGETELPLCCNMPPFNDGLAMKEHIKSWAYAVACTVR